MQLTNSQKVYILVSLENFLYTETRPEVKVEVEKLIQMFTEYTN